MFIFVFLSCILPKYIYKRSHLPTPKAFVFILNSSLQRFIENASQKIDKPVCLKLKKKYYVFILAYDLNLIGDLCLWAAIWGCLRVRIDWLIEICFKKILTKFISKSLLIFSFLCSSLGCFTAKTIRGSEPMLMLTGKLNKRHD